jgi:hypothetical protein
VHVGIMNIQAHINIYIWVYRKIYRERERMEGKRKRKESEVKKGNMKLSRLSSP